ncbi:hypothetical protein PANA5342_3473 [Pantoea ananatis LMG 5342]|nr:hypothetical protein PANA5342_3473 [Pantoea ananatis LMG 5342]
MWTRKNGEAFHNDSRQDSSFGIDRDCDNYAGFNVEAV